MSLSHTKANEIIDSIVRELNKRNKAAIVAVGDSHGELIALLRMDGVKLSSLTIAINKAWTAARSQKPTSEIGKTSRDPENGYDLIYYGDPKYTGFGGGVPIFSGGKLIGSVGVSGLSQQEDEELAYFGIKSVLG